ncbi:acyl-CoA carboxylase epsilon subunit [Nocardioides sp. SYSU D00038]|uniref:acyl-CoA carboxylase epsilon subunit n=1 Tax=Nocardioides sp. SYSU D00038 TaxID=2812554 RepID=UPI001967A277|nr:acyl-CoA carboxylase epsilon subunit [Nocardioides sp. SYSU D00038]
MTDTPDAQPLLRVVTPDTTPEEVAAIVAVFAALGGDEAPARPARSQWAHPGRAARRTLPHGQGGWRASGLPR